MKILNTYLVFSGITVVFVGDISPILHTIDGLNYINSINFSTLPSLFGNLTFTAICELHHNGGVEGIPNIGPRLPLIYTQNLNRITTITSSILDTSNGYSNNLFLNAILHGTSVGAISYNPEVIYLTKLLKLYPALIPIFLPVLIRAIARTPNLLAGLLSFLSTYRLNVKCLLKENIDYLKNLFFDLHVRQFTTIRVYPFFRNIPNGAVIRTRLMALRPYLVQARNINHSN